MADDRHPDMAPEMPRVSTFPMQTFIDEGLLHYFNATVFWPLGLMLTASWYESEGEDRTALYPKLRAALDESHAAIGKWINHGGDNDDGNGDPLGDAAAEALWQAFSADLRGVAMEALQLRQFEPPQLVVSALTPDEATARRQRALQWIAARGAEVARNEAALEAAADA